MDNTQESKQRLSQLIETCLPTHGGIRGLARMVGVDPSTVVKWRDRPPVINQANSKQLATALGTTPEALESYLAGNLELDALLTEAPKDRVEQLASQVRGLSPAEQLRLLAAISGEVAEMLTLVGAGVGVGGEAAAGQVKKNLRGSQGSSEMIGAKLKELVQDELERRPISPGEFARVVHLSESVLRQILDEGILPGNEDNKLRLLYRHLTDPRTGQPFTTPDELKAYCQQQTAPPDRLSGGANGGNGELDGHAGLHFHHAD